MPVVMCFGDSNTHGTMPMRDFDDRRRFGRFERWPGVLAQELGPDYYVIEEGNGGRLSVHDDPIDGAHRSGFRILPALLESHRPLDLLIIMLGTNDCQARFHQSGRDAARGVEKLVRLALQSDCGPDGGAPKVLVVAPVPVEETGFFAETFAGGAAKSRALTTHLRDFAARLGVEFFDAGTCAEVDPVEGVHLSLEAHRAIGTGLAACVKDVI